ncbi:TPA: hypothetical protein ACH3X1_005502 [Trebouxia sp. C0004]
MSEGPPQPLTKSSCQPTMHMQAVCCSAPMYLTPLPLGLANITLSITLGVRPFAMQSLCASQVTGGLFTFRTQTKDSSTYRKPETPASARLSALCLVLWTSTCMCLSALFDRASTHILRAFYFADIGIKTASSCDRLTCFMPELVAGSASASLT